MLPTVVGLLGEVCAVPRRILSRVLGFRNTGSVTVVFWTESWIVFEHTRYGD